MKRQIRKVIQCCKYWLVSGLLLGITACATPGKLPLGQVHEQINRELQQAVEQNRVVQNQTANNNPLAQAFLPPLSGANTTKKTEELRFDLAVNQAPAQQVFMALVSDTKYSMTVSPDVSGSITVNLKSVTVREALEAIRDTYGYEYTISGNRILIQPNTLQTRLFQINYLASKRLGMSELAVAASGSSSSSGSSGSSSSSTSSSSGGSSGSSSGGGGSSSSSTTTSSSSISSRVQTSYEADFWKNLEAALNAIVLNSSSASALLASSPTGGSSTGGAAATPPTSTTSTPGSASATSTDRPSVITNPMSGVVLIRAAPREMRLVSQYLEKTQLVVERQVMLEAKILEVSLSQAYQSGINWSKLDSTGTNTSAVRLVGAEFVNPSFEQGFFGLALGRNQFQGVIKLLETQGNVSVLSSPRIATLNNQKALLKVGTDEVFITGFSMSSTVTANAAAAVPTATTSTLFSGILLDVMPQIDDDDNIILHIHPSVSRVTEKTKSFTLGTNYVITLPLASRNVNEADSVVRTRSGEIVAIGGLMSQSSSADRNGVPGSLDQSFSMLLGQRSSSLGKTELVILLKSTIISSSKAWAQDTEETEERVRRLNK